MEISDSIMSTEGKLKTALKELPEQVGMRLALCCHREVGNLPKLPRHDRSACCAKAASHA